MKVKTRLIISNILMLVIPVILVVLIAQGVFSVLLDIYSDRFEQLETLMLSGNYAEDDAAIVKIESELNELMMKCLLLVGVIAVAIIALVDLVLTKHMLRKIMIPLELLRYGSNQIKEGNLDFIVSYDGNDEFGQVCSDFDEMRLRLKQSVDMQEKYEENRKELIVGISHDLRTPLTTIKGYVEGLQDGIASTPEKQKEYLHTIHNKACDMDTLVDSLFMFSKMDIGRFPFRFTKHDISEYLDDFFNNAKSEFELKGIHIVYENRADERRFARIDEEQLSRVLTNILENSRKYKNKEVGTVKVIVDIIDGNIHLVMSDDGPGVKEEELKKLFTSFFRGDPSRTNSSEGSGLGLSIAMRIVEAHKGSIVARNNDGLELEIVLPTISSK